MKNSTNPCFWNVLLYALRQPPDPLRFAIGEDNNPKHIHPSHGPTRCRSSVLCSLHAQHCKVNIEPAMNLSAFVRLGIPSTNAHLARAGALGTLRGYMSCVG